MHNDRLHNLVPFQVSQVWHQLPSFFSTGVRQDFPCNSTFGANEPVDYVVYLVWE